MKRQHTTLRKPTSLSSTTSRNTRLKKGLLYGGISLLGVIIAVQLAYPANWTKPFEVIDGNTIGGMKQDTAARIITQATEQTKVPVFFGEQTKARLEPSVSQLTESIVTDQAMKDANYSWWLRLVPTSILWAHTLSSPSVEVMPSKEKVDQYITDELGETCDVTPINATIKEKDSELVLVPSEAGGTCKLDDVRTALMKDSFRSHQDNTQKVAMNMIPPTLTNESAQKTLDTLKQQLGKGVAVDVGEEKVTLDTTALQSWLEFTAEGNELLVAVNPEKAKDTLEAAVGKKVAKPASVVTITTHDFQEVSRAGGSQGAALNVAGTGTNIAAFLMAKEEAIPVVITPIEAPKKYIRTYSSSDVGLSALMKNFAEDNLGTYGVSLIELSGNRRRASFNDAKKFTTASTYKAFVAFSVLKRVEAGQMSWGDQVASGRTLSKCFDDMIVLSDNACAEALVKRIGYRSLTNDAASIGATNTSFVDAESYKTTAGDLSLLMAQLETGQLPINGDSRGRFLGALKRNVYRQGIPAGASGAVADKVGFLDGLLHDTAIVYSPQGTYVLTIMTDGSSWGKIAELTKKIEALR